jgi:hypothetical protein
MREHEQTSVVSHYTVEMLACARPRALRWRPDALRLPLSSLTRPVASYAQPSFATASLPSRYTSVQPPPPLRAAAVSRHGASPYPRTAAHTLRLHSLTG